MVKFTAFTAAVAAATMAGSAIAHPGEHHDDEMVKSEIQKRDLFSGNAARALEKCAGTLKAREQAANARRAATFERLRAARGIDSSKPFLHRRDLATLEAFEKVNHNMTGTVPVNDPNFDYFAAGNTSCILTPEVTIGPYYVLGELIRRNVTEGQPGVPVHLEMEFINTATCEPVPQLLIDIWAANSTGVYSGIDISMGQGGLNSSYMRGVQPTGQDGVATFDTIFPGHYEGRAIHQHVVAHVGATPLPNGSYTGGDFAHIGQLFFDESLRSVVEATYPYSSNTQSITSNDDDMWAPGQADNNYDPFPEFAYLSEDITDGLMMWISIGIDPTANHTANATWAAVWTENGGEATEDAIGGDSGAIPSGAVPSGAMPSGVVSSAVLSGTASAKRMSLLRRARENALAKSYSLSKLFGGAARRV